MKKLIIAWTAGIAVLASFDLAGSQLDNPFFRWPFIWLGVSYFIVSAVGYPWLMNWFSKRTSLSAPDGPPSVVSYTVAGVLSAIVLLVIAVPTLLLPSGWPLVLFLPAQLWPFASAYAVSGGVYGFLSALERRSTSIGQRRIDGRSEQRPAD